jgi:thioredoxin-dependent peroxiredoxin
LELSINVFAKPGKKKMRLHTNQTAPAFSIQDVYGNRINLSEYKGKTVLLTFHRNVGCPICNLRFHELQKQKEYFQSKNIVLIDVYESSQSNMQQYIAEEKFYTNMIPDSNMTLYKLYSIELSAGKLMKGIFKGAMGKMMKGKKLFRNKISQDGNMTRIGAEFLIDEKGIIKIAHYGKFVGDHLPLEEIKKLF